MLELSLFHPLWNIHSIYDSHYPYNQRNNENYSKYAYNGIIGFDVILFFFSFFSSFTFYDISHQHSQVPPRQYQHTFPTL